MPVDAYIRVSRVGGRTGASFISPDVQLESVQRIATARGWTLGEVVKELDVSGARPIDERELGRLVRKVEDGESDGILVWKVSRFSRNLLDALVAADRIKAAGGELVGEDLDLSQPMARPILAFLAAFAEEEREARKTGWAEAQRRAVERGMHLASVPPTGYVKDEQGMLVPGPDAARIASAFQLRADGAGVSSIAAYLEEQGVLPSGSTRPVWQPTVVRQVLKNRAYLGEARMGQWVNPQAHEPLVPEGVWLAAQAAKPMKPLRAKQPSLLAGILRCHVCRHALKHRSAGGSRSYRCAYDTGHVSIPARKAEAYVQEAFWRALDVWQVPVEALGSGDAAEAEGALRAAREELSWYMATIAPSGERDAWRAGLETRQQRVTQAESALAECVTRVELDATELREAWPELSVAERREIIGAAIPVAWVGEGNQYTPAEERVMLTYAGDPVPELPRRGRLPAGEVAQVLPPVSVVPDLLAELVADDPTARLRVPAARGAVGEAFVRVLRARGGGWRLAA